MYHEFEHYNRRQVCVKNTKTSRETKPVLSQRKNGQELNLVDHIFCFFLRNCKYSFFFLQSSWAGLRAFL
jgi:hypothetical protein